MHRPIYPCGKLITELRNVTCHVGSDIWQVWFPWP